MKKLARIILAITLVVLGTSAWPFADGFEAHALEPKDIKAISIDAAPPIPVQNVRVDAAGLLTAVKVGPPIPPVPVCKPLPSWMVVHRLPWNKVFTGKDWPLTTSTQMPIGSYTLRSGSGVYKQGKPITDQVITSPFTLDDKPHKLDWVGAQPVETIGYNPGQRANSVTVTISTCPGDVYAACKATAASGAMFYGKGVKGACGAFQPGQQLWATWHFMTPTLDRGLNTCQPQNASAGVKCDGNFGSR